MIVSVLGGLLGILMMIPLRRAFIVKQHGKLKYPEGTACAEVLIAGEKGGASAKMVFAGFGLAFVYKFLMRGAEALARTPSPARSPAIKGYKKAVLGVRGRTRRCWASATSSARGSRRSWSAAASWPSWSWCRRSRSSASG